MSNAQTRIERRNLATRPSDRAVRMMENRIELFGLEGIEWGDAPFDYILYATYALSQGWPVTTAHRYALRMTAEFKNVRRFQLVKSGKESAAPAAPKKPTLVFAGSGQPVKVGQQVLIKDEAHIVEYFREPYSPASEGKVTVRHQAQGYTCEYYVSVIGAEWINRIDR